jgi:diguanylate cyclase (GGDEF)-like protein
MTLWPENLQGVRTSLQKTAALINRNEQVDSVVEGIRDGLIAAVGGAGAYVPLDSTSIDDPETLANLDAGKAWVGHVGTQSAMFAPVRDGDRTIGALWVADGKSTYGDEDLALVEAFAAYLSLALQRASLRERTHRLEQLVAIDPLTGVANRRAFDKTLEREWSRAIRAQRPLAVAMLDIDHFKRYNDGYGHREGDACLQKIARVCSASIVRASDLFARYGGEEFCIILGDADLQAGMVVAERVRAAVEMLSLPHAPAEGGIVTLSIGVASMIPERGLTATELVERADRALYQAKDAGRNRALAYAPAEAKT